MGRPGRPVLPIARRDGDPPTSPCGSGDNHPDRNKRSDDSAGAESPSRIKARSRRSGDNGVPLSGRSLGDLDVFHEGRSTWLAPPRSTCRIVRPATSPGRTVTTVDAGYRLTPWRLYER